MKSFQTVLRTCKNTKIKTGKHDIWTSTRHQMITHLLWLLHQHDGHLPWKAVNITKTCKVKSTHLVNAFFLVHHPSAHCTTTAALPFSTLQWSQTQETLSYTAAQCRRASDGGRREPEGRGEAVEEGVCGSRRGKSRERREWRRREKQRKDGRNIAAQCCHCSPDMVSFPPSSSFMLPDIASSSLF